MQCRNGGQPACEMRSNCLQNADASLQAFLHLLYYTAEQHRGRWSCT